MAMERFCRSAQIRLRTRRTSTNLVGRKKRRSSDSNFVGRLSLLQYFADSLTIHTSSFSANWMRRPCTTMVDTIDVTEISAPSHTFFSGFPSTITNTFSPFQQLIRRHVNEDILWIELGAYRRSYAEFHELKLCGTVRVRPHRNPASFLPG